MEERGQVGRAIAVVAEAGLAVVTALDEMQGVPGEDEARRTWHETMHAAVSTGGAIDRTPVPSSFKESDPIGGFQGI
jgi:hypothetical protein